MVDDDTHIDTQWALFHNLSQMERTVIVEFYFFPFAVHANQKHTPDASSRIVFQGKWAHLFIQKKKELKPIAF